jgi:hypothetical protein
VIAWSIDFQELEALTAAMARNPLVVREELLAAVTEADLLLAREVSERAPVGAGGAAGLKGSIFSVEEVSESGVIGLVGTPVQYAAPVELGTRPHFPPVEPLVDWVRVKLGIVEEREARGVAFLVARKISRKGTKAQRPFGLTFEAQEAQVGEIFERATARIAERLEPGKA